MGRYSTHVLYFPVVHAHCVCVMHWPPRLSVDGHAALRCHEKTTSRVKIHASAGVCHSVRFALTSSTAGFLLLHVLHAALPPGPGAQRGSSRRQAEVPGLNHPSSGHGTDSPLSPVDCKTRLKRFYAQRVRAERGQEDGGGGVLFCTGKSERGRGALRSSTYWTDGWGRIKTE